MIFAGAQRNGRLVNVVPGRVELAEVVPVQDVKVAILARAHGQMPHGAASVGQVGEAKLLLLAALVIADELADANEALEQERNRASSKSEAVRGASKTAEAIAARVVAP